MASSRMIGAAKRTVLKLLADVGKVSLITKIKPFEAYLARKFNAMKFGLSIIQKTKMCLKIKRGNSAMEMYTLGQHSAKTLNLFQVGM